MGPDQVTELARHLLMEAMLLSAPLLLAAAVISIALSVLQTLTSIQEQTITTIPGSPPWPLCRLWACPGCCATWWVTPFHCFETFTGFWVEVTIRDCRRHDIVGSEVGKRYDGLERIFRRRHPGADSCQRPDVVCSVFLFRRDPSHGEESIYVRRGRSVDSHRRQPSRR